MRADKIRKNLNTNECYYISGYPNIFYYSGFKSEDARLIITEKENILLTDSRYTIQAREQAPDFTVMDIADTEIFSKLNAKAVGFEEGSLTVKELARINKGGVKVFPAEKIISAPRQVKESVEIEKIAMAESLGDAAFKYILGIIKAGMTEWEIAFELEMFMRKNGAEKLSFESIAASGVRSAMPHGTASDKVIEKGELLTLDFGCVLDGYCSDMTRTVAIGNIGERERLIYSTVLHAQKTACEKIKVGMRASDADAVARDIIKEAGFGENFGHSLGHSVGIEIHETPNLSPKSEAILVSGNVVTIEPGIYIDGFGGVRIEDLVVLGEKNTVNLTKSEKELIIL